MNCKHCGQLEIDHWGMKRHCVGKRGMALTIRATTYEPASPVAQPEKVRRNVVIYGAETGGWPCQVCGFGHAANTSCGLAQSGAGGEPIHVHSRICYQCGHDDCPCTGGWLHEQPLCERTDTASPSGQAAATTPEHSNPARTKLLMKFWSAMHLAGFAKEKEWDAQEKIHIKDLATLMAASPAGGAEPSAEQPKE